MSKQQISTRSQDRQLLEYYQNKVDELYRQRLLWLSKFDQCGTQLADKQKLMDQLKDHKDKEAELNRAIVHHDVALLDQKINVIKMERENIRSQFLDAEEILKMQELIEQYPQQLQKHLPCKLFSVNGDTIQNQLNIHNKNKNSRKNISAASGGIFRQNNSVLSNCNKYGDAKIKYKPTYEELIKRQIVELKTNQEKQLCVMQEQSRKLEEIIRSVKDREDRMLKAQREIVDQLRNQKKKQDERHRQIAEKYFDSRRKIKEEHQTTIDQNVKLQNTLASLQSKVAEEMKIYEKQNKAKQTLIIRKSQDFEEDYKARMRAKQRNLQALRDNYQKMQDVCIQKIKKLEDTLRQAREKLIQTQNKRQYLVTDLRSQLNILEKQVKEEAVEKARVDVQMRQKIQKDKRKRAELDQQEEQERKKNQKARLIDKAYRKPFIKFKKTKVTKLKNKKHSNDKTEEHEQSGSEQDSGQESMALSDLQNIRQQINSLSNKISKQGKSKK